MPPNISGNSEALYEVVLLPGGDVLSVELKKSSGFPAFDAAVRSAILAAQPLPVPSADLFQNHFRRFNMSFRPKE
jgi:colicin import membrane protein